MVIINLSKAGLLDNEFTEFHRVIIYRLCFEVIRVRTSLLVERYRLTPRPDEQIKETIGTHAYRSFLDLLLRNELISREKKV